MTYLVERADYLETSERVITGVAWDVRAVRREGDRLIQKLVGPSRLTSIPAGGILRRFCGLADAPASRILRCAQRYGLLHLCATHHLPQWHRSSSDCRASAFESDGYEQYDEIEQWRAWSRRLMATVEMTRAIVGLRDPRPSDVDAALCGLGSGAKESEHLRRDWEAIADLLRRPSWMDVPVVVTDRYGIGQRSSRQWERQKPEVQLFQVERWLNFLLKSAQVTRSVVRPAQRHGLALVDGYNGNAPLFGALVTELAAECAKVPSLARCRNPECLKPFRASRNSAAYCPRCVDPQVRWRLAQQARRERLKAKKAARRHG